MLQATRVLELMAVRVIIVGESSAPSADWGSSIIDCDGFCVRVLGILPRLGCICFVLVVVLLPGCTHALALDRLGVVTEDFVGKMNIIALHGVKNGDVAERSVEHERGIDRPRSPKAEGRQATGNPLSGLQKC